MYNDEEVRSPQGRVIDMSQFTESMNSMAKSLGELTGRIRIIENNMNNRNTPTKTADPLMEDIYGEENYNFPETPAAGLPKQRRETMFGKQTRLALEQSQFATIQAKQPDFSHIYLKSLSIAAVHKFISQINQYLIAHRIKLPATTLVDEKIRRRLVASDVKLNEVAFYRLETEDLFARLRKEIRPFSKLDFQTKLQKNVNFEISSGYKPTPTNFLPMYNALLAFRTDFLYVYELMAEDNADNVPECKNKEGGLIKIFLDKIPFEYGKRTFQLLSSDQKYSDIHVFLKAFYTQVQSDASDAQNARRLLQNFGGTEWEKNSSVSLHAIERVDCDSEEDDSAAAEPEELDTFLHAFEPKNQNEVQPCFTKLLSGECTKQGCAYNHREEVLYKKRAEFIERMQKAQASHNSGKPMQVLRRPGHEVKTSYAEQTSDEDADDLNNLREELLLSSFPADWYVRTIHREGLIHADKTDIDVPSVLFDTGALTASYISADFVNQHREALSPFLHKSKGTVRLAAHEHSVDITECALLSVSFKDSNNKRHTAQVKFIVLPGSTNHMVIGWPAIVGSLSTVFLDMMNSAMNEYQGTPSHELLNLQSDLLPPWSNILSEDAPEDTATPLPSAFPDALHFMEMTPDEARQEYYGQIEEHVSAEFRKLTKVVELLSTKGVKAFVPNNWEGIKGIPPLEIEWKDDPDVMKPRARPVNPKLYEAASKELERLLGYFYVPSNSPVASCLVIAPKATKPFIRFCGDYVAINKYIVNRHYPIPNVQRSLDKICGFSIFLDLDLVNAFHQVRLGPKTSAMLSVQTPWGQFAPLFMPEGVAPATFILQETVDIIFREFDEWTIAIFDNLLILAHDYDDAYKKLDIIIDRCIERNVFLKFSKSWLGFDKVHFFGYDCTHNSYALSEDRKKTLTELAPPRSLKGMQSFLGAANFFKSFVPNFSCLASPLTDMTRKDFQWDQNTWDPERLKAFNDFKDALLNSFTIFYPNYELPWILRTDASTHGVAFILFQVHRATPDAETELQPILIASQKFSPQARNWTTIEQEAYGVYFAVYKASYYLRCKEFVIETDHANLQWMEASIVPKIMRWRVYLQSFNFSVRHIAGKLNLVADWLSRIYDCDDEAPATHPLHRMAPDFHLPIPETDNRKGEGRVEEAMPVTKTKDAGNDHALEVAQAPLNSVPPTPESLLAQVHGGRMAHHGARKTWKALNEHFPGHRIPYRYVEDYIAACAICQKDRLGMTDALKPLQRSLHPPYRRKMVGVDTLTVTPPDKWGNQYINVVVVHATKLVALYPSKHKGAREMALALFQFFSTYGVFENLISDPGSDLTSEIIKHLTAWYGIRHVFSLVDRHESNGVEGTNKSILRHLRAIVSDERLKDSWSDPTVLYLVQYVLNSQVSHETGTVPFYAHFGTEDSTYFKLPEPGSEASNTQDFIRLLDENLHTIWEASKKHQAAIKDKRAGDDDPARQNMYQPGDLVLFQRNPEALAPSKLSLRYTGPYEVVSQHKNDVTCRHLCIKSVHIFHVERLKIFHGDRTEAERVALLDHDQFEIEKIMYWRGDPTVRTTMEFFIRYQDGDERWVTWTKDLFDSVPYEDFCRANPPLFPLIFTVEEAKRQIKDLNAKPITEVKPGDTVYVDLRSRGNGAWYAAIELPNSAEITYVIECTYIKLIGTKKNKILMNCSLTGWDIELNHFTVHCYGRVTRFDPTTMIKVDKELARAYPKMLQN